MKYRAKECFTIVDGTDAGLTFKRGYVYDSIPSGYDIYFEELKTDTADDKTTPTIEPKQEPYSKPIRTKTPAPETGCIKPKEETEPITPNKEVIEQ